MAEETIQLTKKALHRLKVVEAVSEKRLPRVDPSEGSYQGRPGLPQASSGPLRAMAASTNSRKSASSRISAISAETTV